MSEEYKRLNEKASSDAKEGYLCALFNYLVSGYYLDLNKERYIAIGQEKIYNDKYSSEADWSKIDDYIRECISEEDRPLITEVTRIPYIRERLKRENSYSVEVRDYGSGRERWLRYTTMRGHDEDHAAISFVNVNDQVIERRENERLKEAFEEQNRQLHEKQKQLEEVSAEQEAQLEEITALYTQLQENQTKLEEISSEQEAQLQTIEEEREKVSTAYGMIEGLSREYHTIWVVSKETSKMRLVRSSGVSTIQNAVQMGKDYPEFDAGFDKYINTYVEPVDRERMHREIAFAEILRQLDANGFYAVNYLRRDDSGHVGYHQIAFANADAENGIKQFVYGFRDIDAIVKAEQKQKEEMQAAKESAEAANAAKTSFLFNMSHDIRTPMNAIIGFRDLLEKHQDDPEKRQDYLNKIQEASTVLLSIINNVLEMARIEKGTLEIDETAWSTEQFNDTLYSVFHEMMKEKGITFTRQIEVKHHYVYCDPTKLREIFINILSNAYKYTNSGGSVNMHLEEIPSEREGWVLYQTTISDTGIGMDEEFLPHIYEEFSRESNTTESRVEGTGLGMPIVKRLIDMLDGTIEVKSKKGEGSSFIVTIPHRIADRSKLVEHAGIEIDPNLFKGKHILLAEDNDFNAEIAIEILTEAGFIVERAQDGEVCLDMLEKAAPNYYNLILMDIQMPNMNGYEATRAIRGLDDADKAGIKILAMTANAFEEDKREALRAGMNGHLPKPINVNLLMKTLAGMLG